MFGQMVDVFCFNHLVSAERRGNSCCLLGPLGAVDYLEFSKILALVASKMPKLRYLQLNGVIIGKELQKFLVVYPNSLHVVFFKDCFGQYDQAGGLCYTWSQLFESFAHANLTVLRQLGVESSPQLHSHSRCLFA
jgi:hypothetical protein